MCRTASPTKRSCRPGERPGQPVHAGRLAAYGGRALRGGAGTGGQRCPGGGGAVPRGTGRLLREHPDSPVAPERRAAWSGPHWYPYDPAFRVRGVIDATSPRQTFEISLAADGVLRCTRVGYARFALADHASALAMYWLEGYGGGLWLPFSDAIVRRRDLRRRPLSVRHDQGRGPRHRRRRDRARLQLRLQPVVRVRRPLVVPVVAAREPAAVRGDRGRADAPLNAPVRAHGARTRRSAGPRRTLKA